MGGLGEFQAISVYRGVEGLFGWRNFKSFWKSTLTAQKRTIWFTRFPQLQLAFGPPTMLEKRDRDIIKASGFKFSKAQLPQFRSYRPGYWPWFLTRDDRDRLVAMQLKSVVARNRFSSDHRHTRRRHWQPVHGRRWATEYSVGAEVDFLSGAQIELVCATRDGIRKPLSEGDPWCPSMLLLPSMESVYYA